MRRNDREITDQAELFGIIEKCDVCRLGLSLDGAPYVVPMNFGCEYGGGALTLYFHCAREGKKLDIIRRNPNAFFEADCSHKLIDAPDACGMTMEYESVMGSGVVSIVADPDEKARGLALIVHRYSPGKHVSFTERELASVEVLKFEAAELSGKRLKR